MGRSDGKTTAGSASKLSQDDEFDLLDGIFADLDSQTLASLDGRQKSGVRARSSVVQTPLPSQPHRRNSQQTKIKFPTADERRSTLDDQEKRTTAKDKTFRQSQGSKQQQQQQQQQQKPKHQPRSLKVPSASVSTVSRHNSSPFARTIRTPQAGAAPLSVQRRKEDSKTSAALQDDIAALESIAWSDDDALTQSSKTKCSPSATSAPQPADLTVTKPTSRQIEALLRERNQPGYIPHSRRFARCRVTSVTEKEVKNFRREKTLIVELESTKEDRRVVLYDEWATTEVEEGDTINIIGNFEVSQPTVAVASNSTSDHDASLPTCTLSYSSDNFMVLHPDTLISATRASDSHFCCRKAVISEKLKAGNTYNPSLVYGNLLHELFQACLLAMTDEAEKGDSQGGASPANPGDSKVNRAFGLKRRKEEIEKLLKLSRNIEALYMINVDLSEARKQLLEKSAGFEAFATTYMRDSPKADAYLTDPRSRQNDPSTSTTLAINTVHDIEEDIWSPKYGLKGAIDATVMSTLNGPKSSMWPLGETTDGLVMPLEIKTGKTAAMLQHRAQTMLYTKMMEDRYDRTIASGLLFYTQTNAVIKVEAARNELRGLIIARNEMAKYLANAIDDGNETSAVTEAEEDPDVSMSLLDPPALQMPSLEGRSEHKDAGRSTTDTSQTSQEAHSDKSNGNASDGVDEALWADMDLVDIHELPSSVKNNPTSATASHLKKAILPAAIDEEKACKQCFAADGCMLYRRAVEKAVTIGRADDNVPVRGDTTTLREFYQSKTGHLTDEQCAFFEQWERLISLEERDMNRFKKEIWAMTAPERQKRGRCFANMVIDLCFDSDASQNANKISISRTHSSRFLYRLRRSQSTPAPSPTHHQCGGTAAPHDSGSESDGLAQSLLDGQISVGDAIVVSVEPSILALARGKVVSLDKDTVVIGVDHSLINLPSDIGTIIRGTQSRETVYRVDKDEFQAGMGKIRDNLARLFYVNGQERLRELIVDLRPPRFDDKDCNEVMPEYMDAVPDSTTQASHLNTDQQSAITKVLRTNDYCLVLGMPGTGKTTTIVEILKELVMRGKSVLLTSYTHSAVDNILLKVKDDKDLKGKILRLGPKDKIMPALHHLSQSALPAAKTIAELESQLRSPAIIGTTALSTDHIIFAKRKFDYCIVDEASQITLPTCLGPLRFANRFVLVGDHKQLPPLVRNHQARKAGLEVSLFKRLSEAHPSAVVELTHQYRMNKDIMCLSNRLIYHDKLKCGTQAIAYLGLKLPAMPNSEQYRHISPWLREIMDENRRVIFVDTDALPARESRVGGFVLNIPEAELIHQTSSALIACGVPPSQLGIITLYKQQIKVLNERIHGTTANLEHVRSGLAKQMQEIEILTADKSQGRDKDCILMTLVRSNEEREVGSLLKDYRRLNVCFTRAKKKLIIIGSRTTLSSISLMQDFFEIIDENSWGYKLPSDALAGGKMQSSTDKSTTAVVTKSAQKRERSSSLQPVIYSNPAPSPSDASHSKPTFAKKQKTVPDIRGSSARSQDRNKILVKANTTKGILAGRSILRDIVNSQ